MNKLIEREKSDCENHLPGKLGEKGSYVCTSCATWVKEKKRVDTNSKT